MNNALNLIGRILLAALFLPAGLSKLSGFEGTVGYIASVGLPLPAVGAAAALDRARRGPADGRAERRAGLLDEEVPEPAGRQRGCFGRF